MRSIHNLNQTSDVAIADITIPIIKTLQIKKTMKMKKRNKIITVLATAAFAFGMLWFTVGPDHMAKYKHRMMKKHAHCIEHSDADAIE